MMDSTAHPPCQVRQRDYRRYVGHIRDSPRRLGRQSDARQGFALLAGHRPARRRLWHADVSPAALLASARGPARAALLLRALGRAGVYLPADATGADRD